MRPEDLLRVLEQGHLDGRCWTSLLAESVAADLLHLGIISGPEVAGAVPVVAMWLRRKGRGPQDASEDVNFDQPVLSR